MESRCRREVLELHAFFDGWFNGTLEATDESFARFESVMADTFVLLTPEGRIAERPALIQGIRDAHGRWEGHDPASRTWIDKVRLHREEGDVAIVTYEEWQEIAGKTDARLSTVVFRQQEGAPNGLEWLHVHETWLRRE